MTKKEKILSYIKNPLLIIPFLGYRGFFHWMKDETYLKWVFRSKMGYWPDLKNPKTFNEKIQWLKLHDRNPLYTKLVDKYEVKKIVADIIGEEYIIPTIGVWDRFEDIDFDKLPNQFVLKCTHDSGGLVICKDKSKLDISAAKKKIEKCLKANYYWGFREWPYKNVKPRIIAEKYMEDSVNFVPEDYKVYCINGMPNYIVVFHNRFNNAKVLSETVYDENLKALDVSFDEKFQIEKRDFPNPKMGKALFDVAKKLCAGYPQVRVDFYVIDERIYFGEITLSTASGLTHFVPNEWDLKLGQMMKIGVLNG